MKRTLLVASLIALSLGTVGWADPGPLKVSASGEGSGGSSMSQEQVKQLALADAKRMALEQAGTAIISETEVNNFELTRDQILAFAQGLVKVLKINEQHCEYDDKLKAMHCTVSIDAEVEVSDGKELFERMRRSRKQEQGSAGELSFGFNVLAFSPAAPGARGVRIKSDSSQTFQHLELAENGVLRSGDEFQIRFTPAQDAHVYVINVDSSGQVYAMLPNPEGMSDNRLRAGRSYTLPAEGKYYQLDNQTGTETIYLMAAREPMSDIEYLLEKARSHDLNVGVLFNAMAKTRGISGITQGPSTSYQIAQDVKIQDIEERIQGHGAVVRVFRIQHK
ncbi:MAG TPA: DUF4384 domain-containing protein [Candidatus Obscuribacterales bacterium]